ncbi:type II toxin-antitoxin system RelB/DinJ family antitoxin [Patescibacteria group bacterium]|nr:type II toxin-antitoxin system RelB/DinJ family antitoxin [Patescibacteria group bacterium]MBU1683676.1 type II toxin-antitoxin system RelB/DinJ family antitoxin [Patescibacteria group bacterium]MBU1935438.1 type II toxin-antitoxin system RelB/DinJ family antitoxin [Patescibacteria group bacterium]
MTTLSIKIEDELKINAQKMANELGISLSSLIKMLLKNTIRKGELYIDTKPKYHTGPEDGDLEFDDPKEAIEYFEKLANEDGKMA